MQAILTILRDAGCYYLATLRDGAPELRPFGELTLFEDGLYFNTGRKKDVYHQLKADGRVCLCAFANGAWVRVRAVAEEDDRLPARLAVLEACPVLSNMYAADDGVFTVFRLTQAEAELHRGTSCETLRL